VQVILHSYAGQPHDLDKECDEINQRLEKDVSDDCRDVAGCRISYHAATNMVISR